MVAMVESHQWYKTGLTCNRHIPNAGHDPIGLAVGDLLVEEYTIPQRTYPPRRPARDNLEKETRSSAIFGPRTLH